MSILIFKYFSILYCSIYTYFKIQNNKLSKLNSIYNALFLIIFSLFLSYIPYNIPLSKTFIMLIFLIIYLYMSTNMKLFPTLIVTTLSFAISYLALTISGFLLSIILTIIYGNPNAILGKHYIILGSCSQFVLIYSIFRIKRLQNGMPFLTSNKFLNYGIGISISTFIVGYFLFILPDINPQIFPYNLLTMLLMLFLAIALLIWWRRKITQSYVEKLRVSEVEILYKEISDRDLEIEKLRANNEQLAGIIHKDNKLIPAMELAVRNYLQTATLMKPEDAKQMGIDLLAKLERMSEERIGIIHTYQEANSYRQRTGLASVDAIVDYMENRATALGIKYHYQYDKGIKEKLPAYISEDDAMHLLSDVIENAIIASTHNEKKNVHIHIGFIQDTLFMDISDGGIPFNPETYQNLGLFQHTTHADHGGSGIGLMDLGKLKKQYKFSLQIYEYPDTEPVFTKKMRILFDRKNHYLIQSYRAKEIRAIVTRNDLHVFQYTDTENEIKTLENNIQNSHA